MINIKCPDDCKHKDKMCQHCIEGSYFDSNAQE